MFTETLVQRAITQSEFQGQQGGGPLYGGVPPDAARLKIYYDQLIIFVADNSGSMSGAKATEASQAMASCLGELAAPANKDGFRVSVITYGTHAQLVHSFVDPSTALIQLDGSGGGTNSAPALSLAQAEIAKYSPRPNRRLQPAVVVKFSDGCLGDGRQAEIEADLLKKANVKVITIGFGSDADASQLKRIASGPDHYAYADVGQLKSLFAQVGKTLSQQSRNAP
jgi:uncharacterized protein YegL